MAFTVEHFQGLSSDGCRNGNHSSYISILVKQKHIGRLCINVYYNDFGVASFPQLLAEGLVSCVAGGE